MTTTTTTITRTRTSLPTFLREKGIEFFINIVDGKMFYVIEDQFMSHSEVVQKYDYTNQSRDAKKVCA